MSKEAVFMMKLELRTDFMAEAEAAHRPASQVLRELMRDFIKRQRGYDEFLSRKVVTSRVSMRAGVSYPNDEVELMFAARRVGVTSQA